MLIILIFSILLIFSSSYGIKVENSSGKAYDTMPSPNKILKDAYNKTKLIVESEGGAIPSNMAALSLPKDYPIYHMPLDKEVSRNKIKGRKGAIQEDSDKISLEDNNSTTNSVKLNLLVGINNTKATYNNKSMSTLNQNVTEIHKPTLLSVEAIAKADLTNNDPAMDDIDERTSKIHKITTSRHPEMIMPIVITVLVVPMFAVIGYMALKRGQEAWKNRHYKRMDFLLDGMYND